MPHLIVAADLSALGAAAGQLATAFAGPGASDDAPDMGHPGAEDALRGFSAAVRGSREALVEHGRAGSESLRGFALAFHNASG